MNILEELEVFISELQDERCNNDSTKRRSFVQKACNFISLLESDCNQECLKNDNILLSLSLSMWKRSFQFVTCKRNKENQDSDCLELTCLMRNISCLILNLTSKLSISRSSSLSIRLSQMWCRTGDDYRRMSLMLKAQLCFSHAEKALSLSVSGEEEQVENILFHLHISQGLIHFEEEKYDSSLERFALASRYLLLKDKHLTNWTRLPQECFERVQVLEERKLTDHAIKILTLLLEVLISKQSDFENEENITRSRVQVTTKLINLLIDARRPNEAKLHAKRVLESPDIPKTDDDYYNMVSCLIYLNEQDLLLSTLSKYVDSLARPDDIIVSRLVNSLLEKELVVIAQSFIDYGRKKRFVGDSRCILGLELLWLRCLVDHLTGPISAFCISAIPCAIQQILSNNLFLSLKDEHESFCLVLWNLSVELFKVSDFKACIEWLTAASPFCDNSMLFNFSRFLSACHFQLGNFQQSLDISKKGREISPLSPESDEDESYWPEIMRFHSLLALKRYKDGIACIQSLKKFSVKKVPSLLLQLTKEKESSDSIPEFLDIVLAGSLVDFWTCQQICCILLTRIPTRHYCETLLLLQHTVEYGKKEKTGESHTIDTQRETIDWLFKFSWNLGLEIQKRNKDWLLASNYFQMASSFKGFIFEDKPEGIEDLRMSYLLSVGCLCRCAEMEEVRGNESLARTSYVKVLTIIESSRITWENEQTVKSMMTLMQFQALASINETYKVQCLSDDILCNSETIGSRCLQILASIAIERRFPKVASNLLQKLIKLKTNELNYEDVALYYRELISCQSNRNESLSVFDSAIALVMESSVVYQVEKDWLVIYAWNSGVHNYKSSQYDWAEKWISRSISLLGRCPGIMSSNHEKQMRKVYDECLGKIHLNKGSVF